MTETTTQNRRLGILEMAGKTEGLAQTQLDTIWAQAQKFEDNSNWERFAGLGSLAALSGGYSYWKLRQSVQAKKYFKNAYQKAISETYDQLTKELRDKLGPRMEACNRYSHECQRLKNELKKPENSSLTKQKDLQKQLSNLQKTLDKEMNAFAQDLIKEAGPIIGKVDASMVELLAQMESAGIRLGRGSASELLSRLGSMSEIPAGLKAPYDKFKEAYDARCKQFKTNMKALRNTVSHENQAVLTRYMQEMEATQKAGRIYEFPSEATLRNALGAEVLGESAQKALAEIGQINGRMAEAGFNGFKEAMQAAISTPGITETEQAALNTFLRNKEAANMAGKFKVPAADAIRTMVASVVSNEAMSKLGNQLQGDFFERIMTYGQASNEYKDVIKTIAQEIRSGAAWPSSEDIKARLKTPTGTQINITGKINRLLETNTKIFNGALPAEQEQALRRIGTDLLEKYGAASNEGKFLEAYLKELKAGQPIPSAPEVASKAGIRSTTLSKEFTTALEAYTTAERAAAAKLPALFEESVKPLMEVLGEAERNTLQQIIADVKSGKPLPTRAELTSRLNLRSATLTPEVEKALTSFANVEQGSASTFEKAAVAFEDDAARVANNARLGATVARLKETEALIGEFGHRRSARGLQKVLGKGEEALAKVLQEGGETVIALQQAKKTIENKLKVPGFFGTSINTVKNAFAKFSRRVMPTAAGGLFLLSISAMINNNTYNASTAEAIAELTTQMDKLNIKVKDAKLFTPEKRKQLVDWALKNTDDPQEKEMLQRLIACDYDFVRYLSEHRGISFERSFAHDITNEWTNEVMKLCQDGFNANFYTQLESRYAPSERTIDHTQTTTAKTTTKGTEQLTQSEQGGVTGGSPTSVPEPDPTASPDPNKKTKPEPDPTAKTDEGPDKKGHSGKRDPNKPYSLDEIKNPQNMSKQDLQDYLERGKILAAKKQLGKLTPEEEQEFKALSSAFNGYNSLHGSKQTDTSGKGNGTQKAPGNPPINTPGNTPGNAPGTGKSPANDAGSSNSDSTKTLPPEALIQADQRGFWERNWDWIVAAVAAVAVAIGAVFLIRKQKKKTDKAKDEASTLQTQVTDLTNKVNELTEKKDGSTLANNSTQINTDTLDGNTGNGENTTIIVPSSKSMG